MRALGLVLVLGAGMVACTTTGPALRSSATLPLATRDAPRQYLVVTVRNPSTLRPAGAASTPRGYDNISPYMTGSVARSTSRTLAAEYGLEEVASWPIAILGVHCLVYALPADADPDRMLAALARDSNVESSQPLLAFETASGQYNDPYANLQENMQRMAVAEAHRVSLGAGVKVAVIDTGADIRHPDLRAGGVLSRNFVDDDDRAFRGDAHGTAVVGIIGAVPNNGVGIFGIAPDAELLSFKACWRAAESGTRAVCNTFTLAQALAAAIEAHADVINLSLAGPTDPLLTRLVKRGLDAGLIVVGAVPADGRRNSFPANIDGVIAADAIETGHTDAGTIRVPGREVLSLAPDGHYDFYSGSSLATAEVSGLVALLRSERPRLTAREAAALLHDSVSSVPGSESTPVPNACTALAALLHRVHCTTTQ